ncbi:hypothetical protein [Chitinophaga sancti]|uniref:Outer membrane protein beta-barrel domain-containing protein n=1 Tax=Chitinophaga sancti TaxID=1004 RepID=A0A1K1MPN3_9BACT|nr:hypothetical protein [Chitinophaga sancti]WQD62866.1 hypothetical protein U0033_00560 [Chitinophaga sancti]WQG91510.1 hypothetical protein SR876_08355 [Chitinophaga sancti]SFW25035.1 hypothetical protein SAMN05661012_00762 [Chitinophaga sancti]
MTKTIQISLLLALFCVIGFQSQAQLKRFSIGPYVETGVPTGDYKDIYNAGWGGGLNADIKLIAGLGVTGSAGYMRFSGKSFDVNGVTNKLPTLQAFPVRVGVKYKFPFPLLYVKAEGGTATYVGDGSGTATLFAPGIGIRFLGLDVEAKYEAWFKDGDHMGFFGLKAGYNF